MPICIVYLASPRDTWFQNVGTKLSVLQKSLSITRKVFPTLDIIVFNEDLLPGDLPEEVKSVKIDFSGLEHRFISNTSHRPYGYHMMCRFFSGVMQSHPALEPYTHYMRLDDDSFFMHPCNIDYSDFLKYDYVFRTTFVEEGHDMQSLYKFTESFLHKRNLYLPLFNKQLAPYNNFHVSSLAMWKHPLVKEYTDEIEKSNLILGSSILDANIHAFIIWTIFPNTSLKLKEETGFGYRHNYHVSTLGTLGYRFTDKILYSPTHTCIETQEEIVYKS